MLLFALAEQREKRNKRESENTNGEREDSCFPLA